MLERSQSHNLPDPPVVPLLPLRGMIVFPFTVTPLEVGRPRSLQALEVAMLGQRRIVLAAQKDDRVQEPAPSDIHAVGTLCEIKQVLKLPEGQLRVLIEGKSRVRIEHIEREEPYYQARVAALESPAPASSAQLEALVRTTRRLFEQYTQLGKQLPDEVVRSILTIEEPDRLLNTIASQLNVSLEDKQAVLEIPALTDQLEHVCVLMTREMEILELEKRIHMRVRRQMEKSQKEYYLREQMKAIQKELGDRDERQAEVEEYRQRIEAKGMPAEVKEKALTEVRRLEKMPSMVAEAVVVRNYLDWLLALPWKERSQDRLDLGLAERILNEDHYGLDKVKERILEYLAVRKLTKGIKGPILCLVGPPGVGKTSLGRSIARALNRKFVRISLGGVRDEAEIRGHRRTYVGAMPGKIVHAMRQAGTRNPVLLLDEIDKMTADFRGDPAAALLEVLDPEQNHSFSDHYLEVPYDLSEVLFVTTANVLWAIPRPLRDRLEIIAIPGYTDEEKLNIARRHLLPKQIKEHGLKPSQLRVSDRTLARIIDGYTREAGVRGLERAIATLCRKATREVVAGEKTPIRVTVGNLSRYLGPPRYLRTATEVEDRVGLAHGLAYTEYGGDVLTIEVTVVKGKGRLTLTGKLGEVMRESAQAGFSYIRSRAEYLDIPADFHESTDIHIHVPEGAIPKDGPSAGIAIAVAVASALSGRPVRHDVAMTGEITLRGRVLAIGGVKEKVLAAHRAGVRTVLLPRDNEKDLEDIPAHIRRKLDIRLVEHMDEVLDLALRERAADAVALMSSPQPAPDAPAPDGGPDNGGELPYVPEQLPPPDERPWWEDRP
ncbi:MAG: endopeptidase La [Firmicutes bacterium ZCTH02-B6]|nr:MAG: endopeptidase La [Firmicutes bacterium ZCTH02-B6]